ncbi:MULTISPECIES: CBO0543 family protein [Paenibacillus]|uniref:CBO0543 family protein n=1 Tax=Paenibacillus violae TaxID=3077234 RepID=A0ABU3RLJ7_9BACL|nr:MULTISPECIES: CBO0543 family protein [Paenibacillus]MDU0205079.1 CBO0543 family protein [Paenibacillus sp. PFR10]MEC0268797.1 hypothetical protein [Paenibacillus anseongense]
MTVERGVLIVIWIVCIILIPIKIPKHRTREAVLLFLSTQMVAWIMSLLLVEWQAIANPIREFPAASGSNFTNNYIFFPMVSTLFALYYPSRNSGVITFFYHLRVVLFLAIYLTLVSSFTKILKYVHFNIVLHTVLLWLVLNAVRTYVEWFYQRKIQKEG